MVNVRQYVFSLLASLLAPVNVADIEPTPSPKSVGIVGAGSAGLAVLKTLLDLPEDTRKGWDIILYEQRRQVGGIWLPDPNPARPPDLPETPLYPLLHTNTPVPTMTYPGFPFPPGTPMYPAHEYVESYHQDYAEHNKLVPYIRYNHTVLSSSWVGDSTMGHWQVVVQDHRGENLTKSFDHLVVANGHNHEPHIVTFPGQDDWLQNSPKGGPPREILHSIWYREPERYINRTVVVVGSGASGRDAASQVCMKARRTYHSVRGNDDPATGPVIIMPEISHFTANEVVFKDGTTISDADSIILGTGYDLRVPFLERGGELSVVPGAHSNDTYSQKLVTNLRYLFPLHEHIFSLSPSYPPNALAFIGLPILVSNCPSDFAQGIYAAHIIANGSLLPPRSDLLQLLANTEEDLRSKGYDPYNVGHRMVLKGSAFDYQDRLVDYLKEHGDLPDDGRKFVEGWRREASGYQYLKRGWKRVEELGTQQDWLKNVETEQDWALLMDRLNEWQGEWERRGGFIFPLDPIAY
ncbi:FAD/NAD(P)-binding domain-containing protein [Leucogyrophana mollusca]|uniref:FAD/NAD(P)-binding domain-containing protein n=1 Tax=Leucogyrophana mollusca TaxID=85980 RepID=A0ACB8BM57_9AGAM|nr:FAD/NAD(P)-binding domain-containing protein [Leucogyrophana mollusca]